MCIAIAKPVGKDIPKKTILKNCFDNNPDGAGFMYANNGFVHYKKGFMTFTAFYKALKKELKHVGSNGKDLPMVFHFRITTQGGVQKELTHPFPISDSYEEMRKTSGTCKMALAHNGVISFASSYGVKDHNDTMEFIKKVAYPMISNKEKFYKNKNTIEVLDYLLNGNRIVILDGNGTMTTFGSWVDDDGIKYSNHTYENTYKAWSKSGVISKWGTKYNYGSGYSLCDDDDYYYDENNDSDWWKEAPQSLIDEIYSKNEAHCPLCGHEMYLDYDNISRKYYLGCDDCGVYYYLDDDTASFCIGHDIGYGWSD